MARLDALSIELNTSGKEKLAEAYGKVIENIKSVSLASVLKNTDLSGDPTTGTVEAKRFVNVAGNNYGTARGNHKGSAVKVKPVVISLNDNTEYVEEVEEKDLRTYGVAGLIEKRTANHQDMLAVELDTKFFAEACSAGNAATATGTTILDQVESVIETVEGTKNSFVNGVPRNKISVICTPKTYGALRTAINALPNSNRLGQMANYEEGIFNNCKIYSTPFLPEVGEVGSKKQVNYIVMVDGAVAQPVMTSILNPEKVQLSDATAFGLFAYKGTKAVMEDLIQYVKEA